MLFVTYVGRYERSPQCSFHSDLCMFSKSFQIRTTAGTPQRKDVRHQIFPVGRVKRILRAHVAMYLMASQSTAISTLPLRLPLS